MRLRRSASRRRSRGQIFFATHVARLEAVAGSGGLSRRPTAQRGADLGDVAEVEFPQGAEMDQNIVIGGVHPVRAA